MSRRWSALAVVSAALVLVVFAFGAVQWFIPSLTLKRQEIVSTPSLDGITVRAEVRVPSLRTACIRPVPLELSVRQVRMLVHATGTRTYPLEVTLRGNGYEGRGRFTNYPAIGAALVLAPLDRSPGRSEDGELCIRNTGPRSIGLVGTNEPESLTEPATYVGARSEPADVDPAITFLSGKNVSIVQKPRLPLDRGAGMTGAVPGWLMIPLALVFAAALPVGASAALLLSARRR
jgi:hypothetical protein